MKRKKMKNIKLINLRAMAILLVVFGHSIILYCPDWGVYQTDNKVLFLQVIKNFINIIQMPIFFSISGYLFYQSINKKRTLKQFTLNKFKRLIIPMIFIGIFYMIPIRCLIKYPPYNNLNIHQILMLFIEGKELGHLWYLIILFIIFIIAYLFMKNIKNNNIFKDLIIFLLLIILQVVQQKVYINTYINLVMSNFLYFYTGILLNKYEKKLYINKLIDILLLMTSFVLVPIFNNQYYNLFCSIISIGLCYKLMPNKTNNIIEIVSKNSFGIYLFHSPLVYITYSFFPNYSPLFVVFLNFLIFGTTAFLITVVMRKTKLKFIIGE